MHPMTTDTLDTAMHSSNHCFEKAKKSSPESQFSVCC